MDRDKAKRILSDEEETANDLTKAGSLIKNPSALVHLFVDGKDKHPKQPYGVFSLDETDLDYFVHRLCNVTLSEKTDYYAEHDVKAEVYTLENGSLSVTTYTATPNGWNK